MTVISIVEILRACLTVLLKYKITHFKQHNTHFHTHFHLLVYQKHSNNIT